MSALSYVKMTAINRVPNPSFEEKETVQVLSEDSGTIGARLTRIDQSHRLFLESAISNYVNNLREIPRLFPQRGDYVLARSEFSEPKWCRALVLSVALPLVQVDQVDYGLLEDVRSTDIIELPPVLSVVPAFSVRLQVDVSQFVVAGKYEVYIGNYVDELQRTVEAFSVPDEAPESSGEEGATVVIPEDIGEVENGVVRGISPYSVTAPTYGIQHREGFEMMAEQLAQLELQPKLVVRKGDFVVVPFDSYFCRALVIERESESARVFHVDFGSWDTVSLSNVFCIPSGPVSETPQQSFQCITDDGTPLEENRGYEFAVKSTLNDHGYPVHICKVLLLGQELPPVYKVTDLPAPCLQEVETVQLVDKPYLCAGSYGAVVQENNASLAAIEQLLEESFGDPDFLNEPQVGDLVISYIDGRFYRSVVCEISNAEICVFQIDVGNFRNCSITVVMTLPEKLLAFPPVALLCLLDENQEAMELMTTFQARNFAHHSNVYGINVYTFETVGANSDASPDLGYATPDEITLSEGYEYSPETVQETPKCRKIVPEQELVPSDAVEVNSLDFGDPTAVGNRSRATTPSSKGSEAAPRKLQHRTFPAPRLDGIQSSFSDVKIIDVSTCSDELVVLSVAFVDRQELLEEALSFIDPDTLKPLYSSDLPSKNPGVIKTGGAWVRVVVKERPSPSSYVVQLVDYGIQTTCSVGEVFCCPPEYVPIEMCAMDYTLPKSSPSTETHEHLIGQIVALGHSMSNTSALYSRETGESIIL